MRNHLALVIVLLAACSKSKPAEPPPPTTPPVTVAIDAALAQQPPIVEIDAAVAVASGPDKPPVDAAVLHDNLAMSEEDATKFADRLTSGPDTGQVTGDLSKRTPNADLAQQLADVKESEHTVKIGGGTRGDRTGTGFAPRLRENPVTIGGTAPKTPQGRITITKRSVVGDATTLTIDHVVRKIQGAYLTGMRRCYTAALSKTPALRGNLELALNVDERGRSVKSVARGVSAEVDACVTNLTDRWSFPIPKDADGEPTDAAFLVGLQLIPE